MSDISRPIVAVRYVQTHPGSKGTWSRGDVGEMCETFLEQNGRFSEQRGGLCLSGQAYHYFTDVAVEPGDLVVVRGGDAVSLAQVERMVTTGEVRATRTVVARLDFGSVLALRRKEAERIAVTRELEKCIRAAKTKEDVLNQAEYYATKNAEVAELLNKLKELEKANV